MTVISYELELFLSSDGKHTVHIKIPAGEDIEAPLQRASSLYDKVVKKYGVMQRGGFQKKPEKQSGGTCKIHSAPMFLNKNGKPYHMNDQKEFCNGHGFPSEDGMSPEDTMEGLL